MSREYFKVPFYVSKTDMRELSYGGVLICYQVSKKEVKELMTGNKIGILHDDFIAMHNDIPYISDRFGGMEERQRKELKDNGIAVFVKESELADNKLSSRDTLGDYIDHFTASDYHKLLSAEDFYSKIR